MQHGMSQMQRPPMPGPGYMPPMPPQPDNSKKTRRRIIAGVAAAGIAIGAYGVYATTLNITDDSDFAAGTQPIAAACDSEVNTDLVVSTTPAGGTFASSGVNVTNVDGTACNGQRLTAWATDASGNPVAETATGFADVTTGTNSYEVDWGTDIADANSIKNVAIVIQTPTS